MGAGRRRGELLDRRREELMEGLLSDDCSWQLLRDAWMDGLLREEDRPAGTVETRDIRRLDQVHLKLIQTEVAIPARSAEHWALLCSRDGRMGGAGEEKNPLL